MGVSTTDATEGDPTAQATDHIQRPERTTAQDNQAPELDRARLLRLRQARPKRRTRRTLRTLLMASEQTTPRAHPFAATRTRRARTRVF